MLSFDIETEGLNSSIHMITVASIFDPCRGIEITYNFMDTENEKEIEWRKCEFLRHLDEAPALCCFNGVKFDIPFIVKRFAVHDVQRVQGWISKLFDLFEVCRLGFDSSCSLQALLDANGFSQGKSASGLQAVKWAKEGQPFLLPACTICVCVCGICFFI